MPDRHLSSAGLRLRLPLVLSVSVACLIGAPAADAASVVPSTSTALPAAIADGGNGAPPQYGAPTTLTFAVAGLPAGPITDVQVNLTSTHTYVGDLDVVLTAPGGSPSRTIFSRTGATTATGYGGQAHFLGPYTFSDSAPATPTWWNAAAANTGGSVPAGTYRASEAGGAGGTGANTLITPSFANATANGSWQLQIRDGSATGTGSITAASLVVRVAGVSTVVPSFSGAGVAVNEPLPVNAKVSSTGSSNATGTFGFDVYGPDNASCLGAPVVSGDAPANGTSAVNAPTLTATAPGLYRVRVRYSGDLDAQAATSACNAATSAIIVSPPFVTFDSAENQAIGAGAPATPSGRPVRLAVQSFCGAPNTPSTFAAPPSSYLAYEHTNAASTPNCVRSKITYPTGCPTTNLFLQSYASPFSAGALNANYLGDAGSSLDGSNSGYTVSAGQAFTDVAFQTAASSCAGFAVTWQSTRPWNSSPPSVSAAPAVGTSAVASEGTWNGSPSFGYTWRRCAADGSGCTDIPGASGKTYSPTADDLGKRLSVRVSASFVDQTSIVQSAPGTAVAAAAPIVSATLTPASTATPVSAPTPTPPPAAAPLSIGTVGQSAGSWKLGKLRASLGVPPKRTKGGTVFSFSISQPAALTLTFARQVDGRKVGSTCLAATKSRAKKPKCTQATPAGSLELVATAAGAQRVVFQGPVSATKTLKPGRYALTVTAKAGAQTATAKPVTFTVRK